MARVAAIGWLLLSLTAGVAADAVVLAGAGEEWRYFKGLSEPSNPPATWRDRDFDDASWPSGPSGFGFGHPRLDGATVLSDMPGRYVAVAFRRAFELSDPSAVTWLLLRVDYNDGFVAYLNGTEVARRGVPGSPGETVPLSAAAVSAHACGATEEIDLTAFRALLAAGTNVLAIQGHSLGFGDPDFTLNAELLANVARGPFVQRVTPRSVTIAWRTLVATVGAVDFGSTPTLGRTVQDEEAGTEHALSLTNLEPATTWHYRVRSAAGPAVAGSGVATFRTAAEQGPVRFAVFGDSGGGALEQLQVARRIREAAPDLVLHTGDVIYPSFTPGYADLRCLSVYREHMRETPYYFVHGNHDLYTDPWALVNTFVLPTNDVPAAEHALAGTSPEHYYSFDTGDAHFVGLFVPYRAQHRLAVGDSQYRWLTNDLARSGKPWKILFLHTPVITSGPHRFDDADGNLVYDRQELREVLWPLAERHGVQVIFAGHDHDYERSRPVDGVHAIVTGGGGFSLYPLTERDETSAQFWSRYHFVLGTIDGDTLSLEARDADGTVFDSATIQRAPRPPQLHQSTWHTAMVEGGLADDGDGNRTGEQFDLRGRWVPAVTGRYSTLGRLRVNNDRTNLYVGLEQVSVPDRADIFLFIESPRLAGRAALAGLGNGVVDATGEGVDGLDFLENLAFTNFLPSVGCVLGDEFADGGDRAFGRPGMEVPGGQGVFQLSPGFPEVAGVRIRQFNRSPQAGGVPGEQNADFIELAVPLAALGGLQGGDIVKIGAVVGGPGVEVSPFRPRRELDTGFLGDSFSGGGFEPGVLQGLAVQLAVDPDPDDDGLATAEEFALGTNPLNSDSDGDGLRDGWEVQHGLDPLSAVGIHGGVADPDGDGATNAQEQAAGTDPRNAASVLKLQLSLTPSRAAQLSWTAMPGAHYAVEFSVGGPGPFSNFPGPPISVMAATNVQVEDGAAATVSEPRFYRLRVAP